MVTTKETNRSLRVGDRFYSHGREYKVVMVNECRARCIPVKPERVSFTDPRTGVKRTFNVRQHHELNISPNSIVELLTRQEGA